MNDRVRAYVSLVLAKKPEDVIIGGGTVCDDIELIIEELSRFAIHCEPELVFNRLSKHPTAERFIEIRIKLKLQYP